MVKNLVIIDQLKNHTILELRKLSSSSCVDLLLFNLDLNQIKEYLPSNINIIKFSSDEYDSFKRLAKEEYIKLPWEILNKTNTYNILGEEYWLLSHTEKNIWKSKIPHYLFLFLQLSNLNQKNSYDKVIYFLNDKDLELILKSNALNTSIIFSMIKVFTKSLKYSIKSFFKYFLMKLFPTNKNISMKNKSLLISIYPNWINTSENIHDLFFGDITKAEIDLILITTDIKKIITQLIHRNVHKHTNIYFLDHYLTFNDILNVFSFATFKKIFHYLYSIKNIKNTFIFSGVNYSPAIQIEMQNSIFDGSYFYNLINYKAFSRFNLDSYDKIFYRLEFQPFEQSFLQASNKNKFIGFQHSIFSNYFLNYSFPLNFFYNHDFLYSFKFPNKLLVTGSLAQSSFLNSGFNSNKIDVVGAVRFQSLFNKINNLKEKFIKSDNDEYVFIPTSVSLEETLAMLSVIFKSFSKYQNHVYFKIKINPNRYTDKSYINEIKKLTKAYANLKINVHFSDIDYHTTLLNSKYVIMAGGSAALEALILNKITFIYSAPNLFSHNPMADYPDNFLIFSDEKELNNQLANSVSFISKNEEKIYNDFFGGKLTGCNINFNEINL